MLGPDTIQEYSPMAELQIDNVLDIRQSNDSLQLSAVLRSQDNNPPLCLWSQSSNLYFGD